MKMYIVIKEDVPDGFAMLAAAHASLACYFKFRDDADMQEWLDGSFRKVICKVSQYEFDKLRQYDYHIVMTESALDNQEVAIVFKPRKEWSKIFKSLSLWNERQVSSAVE